MIDVLVADDHALVRTGIVHILNDQSDIRVVAEAASGEEAIPLVRQHDPDVVLMDVNMPGMGGMEATSKLLRLYPLLRIIALTVHVSDPYPARLLKAGAMGYLTKGCPAQEMVEAIRVVGSGERYVSADIAQELALSLLPGNESSPFEKLSRREMQVMLMVTRGKSIQEISDTLCLSPKTVSTYRHRLYDKLGVDNDVELTHLSIRHGVIDGV
jgi:two-component system invasion response regulator UvrY